MSDLIFKVRSDPPTRVDLTPLTPHLLASKSTADIEKIDIGSGRVAIKVGDVFSLTGTTGATVRFEGTSEKFDQIAANLEGGHVFVDGAAGRYAGRKMRAGELTITGDAASHLGSCLSGGAIRVRGNADDLVSAPKRGERFGMTGGSILIEGTAGDRIGDRMRRGTIAVIGKTGSEAASRMMGGTIYAGGGFGAHPGVLMRRGTLLTPHVTQLLPTFGDCGRHDLTIMRLLRREFKSVLGIDLPQSIESSVHKFSGDSATIGKGELFIFET